MGLRAAPSAIGGDVIARQQEPLIADPKTAKVELALASREIKAAIENAPSLVAHYLMSDTRSAIASQRHVDMADAAAEHTTVRPYTLIAFAGRLGPAGLRARLTPSLGLIDRLHPREIREIDVARGLAPPA